MQGGGKEILLGWEEAEAGLDSVTENLTPFPEDRRGKELREGASVGRGERDGGGLLAPCTTTSTQKRSVGNRTCRRCT